MKNEQGKTKVIGYIRVSTEDQAKEGFSLDAQREKIKGYCVANDLDLVCIESDEGISAKNLDKRPGVVRVLTAAKRKEIGGVVILKLDRMFRSTVDALNTATMLDKKGVALHSINEKLDTQSAMGRFFFTLLAGLATMEREIVSERTIVGLEERRRQGYAISSQAPFGWAIDSDGKLILNKKEMNIVEYMLMMREQLGYRNAEISRRINALGHRTRSGKQWNDIYIANVFANVKKYGRPEQSEQREQSGADNS